MLNVNLEKEKKEKFIDDGRVIADMDNEFITGYKSKEHRRNVEALREAQLSREERKAIYKGALAQVMPIFGIFVLSIVAVIFLLYFFWMR